MNSPDAGGHRFANAQGAVATTPAHNVYDVLLVVPVYNGGKLWREASEALQKAQKASRHRIRIKVVDSSSRDDSVAIARAMGFEVTGIQSADFDHGGTRNAAVRGEGGDVYLFLTQDAILAHPLALDRLLSAFDDPNVALAYGRQLPHRNANPIAAHARQFNYPEKNRLVGLDDKAQLGIKTVFVSNSFAAYRADTFAVLGGFPERNILSEDMYFAARAILDGWKIAYVADAAVLHSHNYTPLEEFKRYFDIGVFQTDHGWIADKFGGAEGEGLRFIKSEARYRLPAIRYGCREPAYIMHSRC